jgi:hypothetical protein
MAEEGCRGELKIAEVTSRFADIKQFEKMIGQFGFKATAKVILSFGVFSNHSLTITSG